MVEKEYYSAKDIAIIRGICRSSAYKEIEEMNIEMKQEYPNIKIFDNYIPIWYWNEKTRKIVISESNDFKE